MKMWSGRFRQPLDATFEKWQRSFDFDCRLLECELEASSAQVLARFFAVISLAPGKDSVGESILPPTAVRDSGSIAPRPPICVRT